MSSYNRIEKFKYSKNPSDVVRLDEYILFTDDRSQTKRVVFKFYNTLNQRLDKIKFEVCEYDEEGQLIESLTALYENCNAEANGFFVPEAKLDLDYACKSISVKLTEAYFDRVKWLKGEFEDNSYKFDKYASAVSVPKVQSAAKTFGGEEAEERGKKKKVVFSTESVAKKNFAVFPNVWCVLVCILVIAFTIVSAILFRYQSDFIYLDGFDLRVDGDVASVCGYDGGEESVTVPETIGDYTITKIEEGAFRKKRVKDVTVKVADGVRYTIETGAFEECSSLETVTIGGDLLIVLDGAFKSCNSLYEINMPAAQLCSGCIRGCEGLRVLTFARMVDTDKNFAALFGSDAAKMNFTRVSFSPARIAETFFEGVRVKNLIVRNENCKIDEGALDAIAGVQIGA